MNNEAFFKISYGLYIISTQYQGIHTACIANTFMQVTDQPKQICFVLNKNNYTTELVNKSRHANIGVLSEDVSMDVIKNFGIYSGRDKDKFRDIDYFEDKYGIRQFKDVVAYFSTEIINVVDVGTHYIFIGYVDEADVFNDKTVLTYEAYHQRKVSKGYRCKVCGFIYEGETLPDDYICPICKVDASFFEKI